jgi:TetR/AcrR family transcriptional regulator, transcriptional repressor of aconitase
MPRVSEDHKQAVRRRILDAALACLERNGFQDITTRELLAEAGLSTGTFYNYFPSKEHLYEALAEEALSADVSQALADGRGAGPDGQGVVPVGHGLLRFLQDFLLANPTSAVAVASFRSRMHDRPEATEAVSRLNRFVIATFAPLVAESVDDGFLRADLDAEALVELIDVVWDGLGRRRGDDAFQTSYARVARVLVQLLLDGIVSPARRNEVPNA